MRVAQERGLQPFGVASDEGFRVQASAGIVQTDFPSALRSREVVSAQVIDGVGSRIVRVVLQEILEDLFEGVGFASMEDSDAMVLRFDLPRG